MRLLTTFILGLVFVTAFAQTVSNVKQGTNVYRSMALVAKKEFQKSAAYPIKTPGGIVKRFGNWGYIHDRLEFVNPKHIGDGEGIALLKFTKGKWTIVAAEVGSGNMEELAEEWVRKYKLPKAFLND